MATVAQRIKQAVSRLKQPAPAVSRLPSVICMDLAPGQFISLGHGAPVPNAPAGFGPSRFTKQQQTDNPQSRMTRVIKDVLSCGRRKAGFDADGKPLFWDVTRQDLQLIQVSFANAQANGVAFNLTKSHGDQKTCVVPTNDIISTIDEVVVEGDALWISSYVTPAEYLWLSNPAMKVSPGIKPDFMDGEGHVYPLQLYHVAVTDQPVVPRQGAFLAMANSQATGVSSMDEVILGWFKQIFEYEGTPLPESVTPENAMDILPIMVEQLIGTETDEEPADETPAEAPAGEVTDAPALTMGNAQAPPWAKGLFDGLATLGNRLNAIENGSKRDLFHAKAQGLVSAGLITDSQAITMTNAAASTSYDTALLDILSGGKANGKNVPPLGRQARTLSNAQPVQPSSDRMSKADIEAAAAELTGGKTRQVKSMA